MRHEADLRIIRQLQDLLELLGNRDLRCLICSGPRPEGNTVLPRPDVHHCATDLVAVLKLLADAAQNLQVRIAIASRTG